MGATDGASTGGSGSTVAGAAGVDSTGGGGGGRGARSERVSGGGVEFTGGASTKGEVTAVEGVSADGVPGGCVAADWRSAADSGVSSDVATPSGGSCAANGSAEASP